MVKVSLIILAFNSIYLTLDLLNDISWLKISNFSVETLVVDNASTDKTVEKLQNFKLPNMPFRLIKNKTNLGFAGGNNVGINLALKNGSDYVLLLNNDVIIPKDLLSNLVKAAEADKQIGLVAPKIYFAKGYEFHKDRYSNPELGKVIWYAGGILDTKNILCSHRGVDEVDHGQYDKEVETDFATGAAVLINTRALQEIGNLAASYFLYWEDVELSFRMRKAGWKVIYTPAAYLWHKVSVAAGGSGGDANDYFLMRNRLAFGLRYMNWRTKLALIRDSLRILSSGRSWQKRGVIDFYLGRMGRGSWKR